MTRTANQDRSPEMDITLQPSMVRRQARPGWIAIDFGELWSYRELLVFHAIRDIKVRYKQTLLGAAWAVLQPVMTMVVFSLFFGKLAKVPSDGFPYPVFAYCALLPWQLFSFSLTASSNSLVDNAEVLTKVYYPRLILPLSSVIVGLVDFVIAFLVLIGMMAYYDIVPGIAVLTLPFITLLAVAAALSAGFWLAPLNVKYHDIRYTIPFLTQLWLFSTPVVYSSSLVPERWQVFFGLNPMVGVVEGFRWALLGSPVSSGPMIITSVTVTFVLLVGGMLYFRRMEKDFADIV